MATKEVTFIAQYTKHFVLRRPKMDSPLASGGWVQSQGRVAYQFIPTLDRASGKLVGELKVREGQDQLDTDHDGTLAAGKETGVMRDAVQFLMDHRAFGEDFWLLGHEPGTVYPRPEDWRSSVRRASVALDEDGLVEMIAQEQRTHGRGDLVSEAEDALALIREMRAEVEAQQAAEPAPEPAPAPAPKAKAKPKAAASA